MANGRNQEFHLFEARDVTPLGQAFDRNEVLEVRWLGHADLKRMLLAEQILEGHADAAPVPVRAEGLVAGRPAFPLVRASANP